MPKLPLVIPHLAQIFQESISCWSWSRSWRAFPRDVTWYNAPATSIRNGLATCSTSLFSRHSANNLSHIQRNAKCKAWPYWLSKKVPNWLTIDLSIPPFWMLLKVDTVLFPNWLSAKQYLFNRLARLSVKMNQSTPPYQAFKENRYLRFNFN